LVGWQQPGGGVPGGGVPGAVARSATQAEGVGGVLHRSGAVDF